MLQMVSNAPAFIYYTFYSVAAVLFITSGTLLFMKISKRNKKKEEE